VECAREALELAVSGEMERAGLRAVGAGVRCWRLAQPETTLWASEVLPTWRRVCDQSERDVPVWVSNVAFLAAVGGGVGEWATAVEGVESRDEAEALGAGLLSHAFGLLWQAALGRVAWPAEVALWGKQAGRRSWLKGNGLRRRANEAPDLPLA